MNKWKKQSITIYAGQAFSLLGSSAVQFAVIWWLTIQTESAVTLTLASIVAFIPGMIIGPFAGVWIDRYNRCAGNGLYSGNYRAGDDGKGVLSDDDRHDMGYANRDYCCGTSERTHWH